MQIVLAPDGTANAPVYPFAVSFPFFTIHHSAWYVSGLGFSINHQEQHSQIMLCGMESLIQSFICRILSDAYHTLSVSQ